MRQRRCAFKLAKPQHQMRLIERKMAPTRSILKSGRPPTARQKPSSLSKRATSQTIRSFHQLNKALATAEAKGDGKQADELRRQIASLGGLESYQIASIQGQAMDRGGDSSVVLMEWLHDVKTVKVGRKLRMLEVGVLSTQNACSRSGIFDITRIDLNSQGEGILKQDFMIRPLPTSDEERFDVLSLSLVLNFVPSPAGRGEMLERTCFFLTSSVNAQFGYDDSFPSLFLVLPAACTTNSRFMNEERLALLMASLGYALRQRKQTNKLVYYLWTLRDEPEPLRQRFEKKEVNSGRSRNNFCIVLEGKV